MKILLVITKAEIGGAQMSVFNLAKEMKKRHLDVSVAFGEGEFLPKELEKRNIPYYKLNKLKRDYNPINIIKYIRELNELIRKENFDVLHFNSSNSLPGVLVSMMNKNRIKTIFTVRGLSVLDKNYPTNYFKKLIFWLYFKFFFFFLSNAVYISQDNFKKAKKLGLASKGKLIYNGLKLKEEDFYEKDKAREKLRNFVSLDLENCFLIGSTGRLSKQKNYQFLIHNFSKIKEIQNNAKLIIIGEGPEKNYYLNLIKEKNLQDDIILAGEMKNASKVLKAFDLFILPSLYEGLSISLIETQVAKVPTLASDVGGNREIIGEENCFALNDEADFLEKFRRGYKKPETMNEFPIEITVDKYVNLYGR